MIESHVEARQQAALDVADLPVSAIRPSNLNPRRTFDQRSLQELAESIAGHGVLQPIVVYPDRDGYRIIVGERRWRAARLAGLEVIPAIVHGGVTKEQAIEMTIIENLQRVDLNPIEEAEGYRTLIEVAGKEQQKIGEAVNRSQTLISRALQLLKLPDSIREQIRSGALSGSHGHALARYAEFPKALCAIAEVVCEEGLTTKHVEAKLGTWGPAGVIGVRLVEEGLAIQINYGGDPCHRSVCPFHARFGDLCLDPAAHEVRVREMDGESGDSGDDPGWAETIDLGTPTDDGCGGYEEAGNEDVVLAAPPAGLKEVIEGAAGDSHRGFVILAVLALRSCGGWPLSRSREGVQPSGEFSAANLSQWEGLTYLDSLDAGELMRMVLLLACKGDLEDGDGEARVRSEVATYLMEGVHVIV